MIAGSFGSYTPETARDHETPPEPLRGGVVYLLGVIRGFAASNLAGLAVLLRFGEALAAGLDLGFGGAPVGPGLGAHLLAGLYRLVDLEEVLDLQPLELGHVMDVTQVL